MNKILLTVAAAIVAATLFACVPGVSIKTDAQEVAKTASQIADFSLPTGYVPEMAGKMGDYIAASYNRGDGHSHLYLIQSQKAEDGQGLSESLTSVMPGSRDRYARMTVIEKRTATIRGQAATVVISDGVNSEGQSYRQATAAFQGKGGPALLVLEEPMDRWNQAAVDAFVASLK